jgi:protein TonB
MMTLRNSLPISILCHILFFGCAIALARYTGNALRQSGDVIQVSLVAPGNSGTAARTAKRRKADPIAREHTTVAEQPSAPPAEATSNDPLPLPQNGSTVDADTGTSTDDREAEELAGSRSGPVSAEYLGLVEAIERVKKYPRVAREHGMEGVVRLRFLLNHSGGVDAVEIMKSSGYEVLDSASVSAIYRAAPMPYVHGWVEMPIRYVLK